MELFLIQVAFKLVLVWVLRLVRKVLALHHLYCEVLPKALEHAPVLIVPDVKVRLYRILLKPITVKHVTTEFDLLYHDIFGV